MANNPKKGPFDLNIDLDKIPSYATRFKSMDSMGSCINMEPMPVSDTSLASDPNLKAKIKSGQDVRSNPSVILRRQGKRV